MSCSPTQPDVTSYEGVSCVHIMVMLCSDLQDGHRLGPSFPSWVAACPQTLLDAWASSARKLHIKVLEAFVK